MEGGWREVLSCTLHACSHSRTTSDEDYCRLDDEDQSYNEGHDRGSDMTKDDDLTTRVVSVDHSRAAIYHVFALEYVSDPR